MAEQYTCDRCGRPAIQNSDGDWMHAEVADSVFCGLVMRAPGRVNGDGDG